MIRLLIASAMICIVATPSSARPSSKKWQVATTGCDAMRPCYGNWNPQYDSAEHASWHSHHVAVRHWVRHKGHRRIPVGLARVMAEGAGRAVGLIRSASGAKAHVANRATGAFQCLVSALDRQGYPIRFMGGWRAHGSVHGSLHPAGLALDINQYGRNVTRPRMPHNEIALANSCGLVAGAQWAHADSGHFQLGGWSGGRHEARRQHRRRTHYANARW
ncbi:hypothetical protein GGQ85_002961 [Nitrobacter vulgaris]|uniref:Peptidase M15C domain-containing protein n=1 Tax=Nitrobacter vulgaris TaxID=29421 RepID=A0A1V4HXF9_NITVU|nr:hypothetical protein [Nitrobacter vulgaris]MDR6305241.1 hypothetical protein [Nitrobacter vulgaris]OPH82633.1 hypothetical protein B2M20_11235 [Nitrobacter vulgaris]